MLFFETVALHFHELKRLIQLARDNKGQDLGRNFFRFEYMLGFD